MKIRVFLSLIVVLTIQAADAAPQFPSESCVSIQVGISKTDTKSRIKVTFVEMVEDSRCPADVTCVWAGNAKIRIQVSKTGRSKNIDLNSTLANEDNTFAGYTFKLVKLTPEPRSNIRINKNGYIATISLIKTAKS